MYLWRCSIIMLKTPPLHRYKDLLLSKLSKPACICEGVLSSCWRPPPYTGTKTYYYQSYLNLPVSVKVFYHHVEDPPPPYIGKYTYYYQSYLKLPVSVKVFYHHAEDPPSPLHRYKDLLLSKLSNTACICEGVLSLCRRPPPPPFTGTKTYYYQSYLKLPVSVKVFYHHAEDPPPLHRYKDLLLSKLSKAACICEGVLSSCWRPPPPPPPTQVQRLTTIKVI